MKRKWTLRLGVLVILIIFGVYLRIHKRNVGYIKRYKLLNVADSTEITSIKIVKSSDTVLLKRENSGWKIDIKGRLLPANTKKIDNLAGKFVVATYQVAGINTKNLSSYGINDTSSTKLMIGTKDGKTKMLEIGKRGPLYSSFYFVFPDKKRVYVLFGIPLYEISTNTENYRDKEVLNLKIEDIKSFTLINEKDTFKVTQLGDTFISNPPEDTSVIKGVLNRARVLTAFGFADDLPDSITGIKNSNKKILFVSQQDDTIEITVGKKGKSALYVSTNKRPGEIFKVYLSWFDEVLEKANLSKKG